MTDSNYVEMYEFIQICNFMHTRNNGNFYKRKSISTRKDVNIKFSIGDTTSSCHGNN